jgi:hypothetical protein
MCTELLPPGGYPIAVEYIIYHTISYHIKRRWEGVERNHLAYDKENLRALVNAVMDLRDSGSIQNLTR